MAKIPFKVSARAARLIGRENVATSQGAITELVKNAYDADASACVVLFLPRYENIPTRLSSKQYLELERLSKNANHFYPLIENKRTLNSYLNKSEIAKLNEIFIDILDLWIIDNGHGMSAETIENHWMVIGTNVKEIKDTSVGGRTVTGAKGIGRFALDRLGQECELFSAENSNNTIAHWLVDWGDFEGVGKVIDDVEAILETEQQTIRSIYHNNKIDSLLPKVSPEGSVNSGSPLKFDQGTAIKISHLHDIWDASDSSKLKKTLEALLPPRDQGEFNIYIYDYRLPDQSGWIDNFPPDQFDYRMIAKIDKLGDVSIELDRQEFEASKISPTLFKIETMQTAGYSHDDFVRGNYKYNTNIQSLLKLKGKDDINQFIELGPLNFTLYFFKLTNPSKDNLKRYPMKNFDVSKRRSWLDNSGGIRLYRDGFRVRPYGEPNTQGSDWLLLGQRVAANPAAAKRIGWRVPPQQLAGTINISRADNPLLADQSNREGIMNDRAFSAFRKLIIALIQQFENDRSYIIHHLDKAYDLDNPEEKDVAEGKKIAKAVLSEDDKSNNSEESNSIEEASTNITKVAKALESEERKNLLLNDDIQVMRGMATLGTVLLSFTHELKQIKANMNQRHARLVNALEDVVDYSKLESKPKQVNPFSIIDRWNREDAKVSRWINFALSAVSPNKRRRLVINIDKYAESLSEYWDEHLQSKKINLHINYKKDYDKNCVLAHEIDLDSIFYNLIVNSVEALTRPSEEISRDIWIDISNGEDEMVEVTYKDNGPGLSSDFKNVEEIFLFGVSSKANDSSDDISGTGMGMWLIKNIINDYNGSISILSELGEPNFSLLIKLPTHKKV